MDSEQLRRGLDAYREVRAAFDSNRYEIQDLELSQVASSTIDALYPFDFESYLPALTEALGDRKSIVQLVSANNKQGGIRLDVDRLEILGFDGALLQEFYVKFLAPTSDELDAFFSHVMATYTDYLQKLPRSRLGYKPVDVAHDNVQRLVRNLAYGAWVLAHWEQAFFTSPQTKGWLSTSSGRSHREGILRVTLLIHEKLWQPLIQKQQLLTSAKFAKS